MSKGISTCLSVISVIVLILAIVCAPGALLPSSYSPFDDELLHQIVKNVVEAKLPLQEAFDNVTAELVRVYPAHIHPSNTWILNCAGGFKTQMLLLHASLSE